MQSKAIVFEFTSYSFEPAKKRAVFNYKTEFSGKKPLIFTETILLPKAPNLNAIPKELLEKLLQSLHIMLGISYYKFYPIKYRLPQLNSAKGGLASLDLTGRAVISQNAKLFNRVNCAIDIRMPYKLSKSEADFWNVIYKKGLGEFFYKNKLNPNISPKFPFAKNKKITPYDLPKNDKCLVGIGGGKDSIVAAKLLKENNFDITAFAVQTNKESKLVHSIIETIGIGDVKIQRFLDWQVHQTHQYNGHIPISAVYAFLGVFAAVLYNYSHVIVGNEYSSNFGNIKYKGILINHQWSKSFEFEKLFQDYAKSFISPDILYFSLLRSFYEIRVVKMFSKLKKYFPYFSSCNRNFALANRSLSESRWCGQCPKCVFVFTLLSAYLSKKDLIKIFGKNLYEDRNLLPLFKDILGLGTMKPFDCVGTFEEAQSAMYLAKKNFKNDFMVKTLAAKIKYHKEVFTTNKESNVPEQFKFLGMKNALILGYGKEGKITQQYLKKYYSLPAGRQGKLHVGVADEKDGKNYLTKQENFDIAIKTPGIKKELVKIPYTTATNIFFSKVLGENTIIGVTGSKGKSTTSSLIFEILKAAGKNVIFLGNIGKPMLEYLSAPVKKDAIFVLELSSYQLDDIVFSPDIAVVTNLFPEHMDYHNGVKNYYKAKKNIINFQDPNDYFIYNPKNKEVTSWLKNYRGKAIPLENNIPVKDNEIPLIGSHNKDNIRVAVAVAKILNIKKEVIIKAIKKFKGLPHRLEFVGEFKGIKFYDDAISTTPESTIQAIQALKNVDTIFLGGQDRGYDFSQLEKTIKKYNIKNVVLFPDSKNKILKHAKSLNVLKTNKMQEAVKFAYQYTKKGSVCLLSCASPSYSLWKNFEEKGDEFKYYVKKLSNRPVA